MTYGSYQFKQSLSYLTKIIKNGKYEILINKESFG